MNTKELIEALNSYIYEDYMGVYVGNEDTPSICTILLEFLEDKSNGNEHYAWRLIPKDQYHNALKMYMRDGEDFKFPEHILNTWLDIICYNVLVLDVMTELAGHTSFIGYDEVNDILFGEDTDQYVQDFDTLFEELDNLGFYDWAMLPDGTDAISDYGRDPIFKILNSLPDFPKPHEMLIAINRCLDVAHCRGDLASAFIEGGKASCEEISNT